MNKTKIILLILLVFSMVSLLTYLNYEKIQHFFTNREWELADSIGKIEVENCIAMQGNATNCYVITSQEISGYTENIKKTLSLPHSWKEVVCATAGEYLILAEKNGTEVMVISKDEKVWGTTLNNGSILSVTINKNGYSAVVYTQTAYKSLVKVFSPTGTELFTSYFASTYAVDVAISQDNKTLAIAEVDTNGISLVSAVKLIPMQNATENQVQKISMEKEEFICDVEYNTENQLVVMTDENIKILKEGELKLFVNLKEENIQVASIRNGKGVVAIQTIDEGLFNVKCYVRIYHYHDAPEVSTYTIEETPTSLETMGDIIAVNTGNKIIFLNVSGRFVKKCEYQEQLKEYQLFNNGNDAVLLFRNTAEFVKVGGM